MRLKQDELHLFQTQNQNTDTFFLSEERTSKKGTDPLFWNRYESAKDTNSIFLQATNAQTCTNAKC